MATVADLMVKDVLTVEPSDTIGEAAEKMHDANVGAVVVVEDMVRIVGIVVRHVHSSRWIMTLPFSTRTSNAR